MEIYVRVRVVPLMLLFLAPSCVTAAESFASWRQCTLTFASNGRTVTLQSVPVADTWPRQHQGLTGSHEAQMLFVWPQSAPRVVWMHDTPEALDAGFIDTAGRLFQVTPMVADTDTYHYSTAPASAILELRHGTYAAIGLVPGATMIRHTCAGGGKPPADVMAPGASVTSATAH